MGSVQQELNILQENLSPQKLIEKLNTGEYLTTLEVSHPDLNTTKRSIVYFDEEGNEIDIAEILSQTVWLKELSEQEFEKSVILKIRGTNV